MQPLLPTHRQCMPLLPPARRAAAAEQRTCTLPVAVSPGRKGSMPATMSSIMRLARSAESGWPAMVTLQGSPPWSIWMVAPVWRWICGAGMGGWVSEGGRRGVGVRVGVVAAGLGEGWVNGLWWLGAGMALGAGMDALRVWRWRVEGEKGKDRRCAGSSCSEGQAAAQDMPNGGAARLRCCCTAAAQQPTQQHQGRGCSCEHRGQRWPACPSRLLHPFANKPTCLKESYISHSCISHIFTKPTISFHVPPA